MRPKEARSERGDDRRDETRAAEKVDEGKRELTRHPNPSDRRSSRRSSRVLPAQSRGRIKVGQAIPEKERESKERPLSGRTALPASTPPSLNSRWTCSTVEGSRSGHLNLHGSIHAAAFFWSSSRSTSVLSGRGSLRDVGRACC